MSLPGKKRNLLKKKIMDVLSKRGNILKEAYEGNTEGQGRKKKKVLQKGKAPTKIFADKSHKKKKAAGLKKGRKSLPRETIKGKKERYREGKVDTNNKQNKN